MLHCKKTYKSIKVEIGQSIWSTYGIKIPTPCAILNSSFFIPVLSIKAVIKESFVRKPQTAMSHTFTITLEM